MSWINTKRCLTAAHCVVPPLVAVLSGGFHRLPTIAIGIFPSISCALPQAGYSHSKLLVVPGLTDNAASDIMAQFSAAGTVPLALGGHHQEKNMRACDTACDTFPVSGTMSKLQPSPLFDLIWSGLIWSDLVYSPNRRSCVCVCVCCHNVFVLVKNLFRRFTAEQSQRWLQSDLWYN